MYHILEEDTPKVMSAIQTAVEALSKGARRVDLDITVGEDASALQLTAYWVCDIMRLDIMPVKEG